MHRIVLFCLSIQKIFVWSLRKHGMTGTLPVMLYFFLYRNPLSRD